MIISSIKFHKLNLLSDKKTKDGGSPTNSFPRVRQRLICEFDYYNQLHLVKNFQRFLGINPRDFGTGSI